MEKNSKTRNTKIVKTKIKKKQKIEEKTKKVSLLLRNSYSPPCIVGLTDVRINVVKRIFFQKHVYLASNKQ